MSEARLLAVYADAGGVRRAIAGLRERGLVRVEAFSPLPDARIEDALLPRASGVRGFTLAGGLLGCASGLGLAVYTSLDWPLITGGKPIVSLPPFLIIAFELAILLGALAGVFGFLFLAGLPRFAPPPAYDPRFSEDRFGVLASCPPEQVELARELLAAAGAEEVRHV